MLQVGRDKRAKAKLNQVGVLLPPRLGPAMAGKGQHQPVRVHHFLLQLDTAPATLPPLTAFDKLFYLHCPQPRIFFLQIQGTFFQGFPLNHCCKALEAKLALQRLEPDSATEAAFIKANVHQICLLSTFVVHLFFILFCFLF